MVTPALVLTTSSVSTSTSTLTLVFTTPSFAEVAAKIPMTPHPLFSENKNTTRPKAAEDLHLRQIQNFHPSHGPVDSHNSRESDQDLNPSSRN